MKKNTLRALSLIMTILFSSTTFAATCYVADMDIRGEYTGACINGQAHGEGISIGKDKYEGNFAYGRTDGKGVYTWATGEVYSGDWRDGRRTGKGVLTYPSGSKYEGEYRNDKRNGLGKLVLVKSNQESINSWQNEKKGQWVDDVYVVEGVFVDGDLQIACDINNIQSCVAH